MTYLGPFISSVPPSERIKPGILNHPTGVAVDPDGDIYVTDWGNHRLCIFDKTGSRSRTLWAMRRSCRSGASRVSTPIPI